MDQLQICQRYDLARALTLWVNETATVKHQLTMELEPLYYQQPKTRGYLFLTVHCQ